MTGAAESKDDGALGGCLIICIAVALLWGGCSWVASWGVSNYDECILKYVKPSMAPEAIWAVRASCAREYPDSAPKPYGF